MTIILFIFLSIIPSLIWLAFFLKEDPYPEPRKVILKTFLIGILFALPVIAICLTIEFLMRFVGISFEMSSYVGIIFLSPVIEELSKYLALKSSAFKSSYLDEPVDFMVYAITAALGFAAMENLIFLFPGREILTGKIPFFFIQEMMMGSAIRFASGTLLHALSSGIVGFFLALSAKHIKKRFCYIGLALSMLLHGFYNFSIISKGADASLSIMTPVILISAFIVILFFFFMIRRLSSVCYIQNQKTKNEQSN
ncbi:MAG: PrsW family intramembrane metalloprotease [Minisyncoccales bacterium]